LALSQGNGNDDAYCPHCQLLVERGTSLPWPAQALRCPHCQLLIGEERGLAKPSAAPGAKGTAAGVFSRQAKRAGAGDDAAPPKAVLEAIRAVAETHGQRPDRLLMVDYQQEAAINPDLPPLPDVFEAFGSWKAARRKAAEGAG